MSTLLEQSDFQQRLEKAAGLTFMSIPLANLTREELLYAFSLNFDIQQAERQAAATLSETYRLLAGVRETT